MLTLILTLLVFGQVEDTIIYETLHLGESEYTDMEYLRMTYPEMFVGNLITPEPDDITIRFIESDKSYNKIAAHPFSYHCYSRDGKIIYECFDECTAQSLRELYRRDPNAVVMYEGKEYGVSQKKDDGNTPVIGIIAVILLLAWIGFVPGFYLGRKKHNA